MARTPSDSEIPEPGISADSLIPLQPVSLRQVDQDDPSIILFRGEIETTLGQGAVALTAIVVQGTPWERDLLRLVEDLHVGLAISLTPDAPVDAPAAPDQKGATAAEEDQSDEEEFDLDIEIDFTSWQSPFTGDLSSTSVRPLDRPDPQGDGEEGHLAQVVFVIASSGDTPIGKGERHRYRVRAGVEGATRARIHVRQGSVSLVRLPDGSRRTETPGGTTPWMAGRRFRVVGHELSNSYRWDGHDFVRVHF